MPRPGHRAVIRTLACAASVAAFAGPCMAQPAEVRVTATPLPTDGLEAPQSITVLRGLDLERRQSFSLGETLSAEPGVQSSGFGTVGRPIIRGLDGPRVRVTADGLESLDASTLSPDHAVTADPLAARQVEVLRGPATLLYGGGAIGGLVNVVTDRIPQARLSGVRGEAQAFTDSAGRGGAGGVSLRGGARGLNWTASGFGREAGDYVIPGNAVAGDPTSASGRLPNSFARSHGGSLGASYVGTRFTAGLAWSSLDSRYGIPGEDASIDLRQTRTEALAEWLDPVAGIESIRLRTARNRYRHDELESTGEVGTAFRNDGRDSRIEMRHAPLAGVRGVLGVQLRDRRFSALGEEAYVPPVRERFEGLFYVAQRALGPAQLEFGARHENARLDPAADTALPSRRFGLRSASVGATLPVGDAGYSVGALLTHAQRAPSLEELYADGPHAATRTFEIGDTSLRRERATNIELSLRRTTPTLQWKVAAFVNRFRDYIYGRLTDDNGDGVPDRTDEEGAIVNAPGDAGAGDLSRVAYAHAGAVFRGLEAQARWQPQGSPWALRAFGDVARGTLSDGGGAVPRMTPARVGLVADYARGAWSGFASVIAVQRQSRLAALETPTASYTRVDGEIAYRLPLGARDGSLQFFVQGRNLLNEEIRLATSFIKDVAPQPGRSVLVGVRGRL